MASEIHIRPAVSADIKAMETFIFEHGKNEWNYLPEKGVREHLAAIGSGKVHGVIAEKNGQMAGLVTFRPSTHLAQYSLLKSGAPHGYIQEAVVHKKQVGQGIGPQLLRAATQALTAQGFHEIFIEHHEQNAASASMIKKAGFVEVDTFDDPARRPSGSRRTTVSRLIPEDPT